MASNFIEILKSLDLLSMALGKYETLETFPQYSYQMRKRSRPKTKPPLALLLQLKSISRKLILLPKAFSLTFPFALIIFSHLANEISI